MKKLFLVGFLLFITTSAQAQVLEPCPSNLIQSDDSKTSLYAGPGDATLYEGIQFFGGVQIVHGPYGYEKFAAPLYYKQGEVKKFCVNVEPWTGKKVTYLDFTFAAGELDYRNADNCMAYKIVVRPPHGSTLVFKKKAGKPDIQNPLFLENPEFGVYTVKVKLLKNSCTFTKGAIKNLAPIYFSSTQTYYYQ
jgi:hypothetical protein